jgi:hypothetical protein
VNNFHQPSEISTLPILLKALWRWLLTSLGDKQEYLGLTGHPHQHALGHGGTLRSHLLSTQPFQAPISTKTRPLRVLRVLETGQTRAQVGRMVISGRMADVCAELDRMAAREVIR